MGHRCYLGVRRRDRRSCLRRAVGSPEGAEGRLRRELRQQAERISAWFSGMHKDPHDEYAHEEDPRREAWLPPELRGRAADVELLNNSEDPVTDVLVSCRGVEQVQRWWDQEPEYRVMIGVLPPGQWTISVPRRV